MRALTGLPSPPFHEADFDGPSSSDAQTHEHGHGHGSMSLPDAGVDLEAYHLALGHVFSGTAAGAGLDSEFFDLDYDVLPASTISYSALGLAFGEGGIDGQDGGGERYY